jgi:Na+/melibiose symporter-like transporter
VGSAFCIQLGSGFGAFIPSKIMSAAGFVANKTQSAHTLSAIHFTFIYFPVIIYAIVALIMCLYFRYEKMEPQIKAELAARHAKEAND